MKFEQDKIKIGDIPVAELAAKYGTPLYVMDEQVIRNSLKGFNTGWCYMAEDDGAYKTYADEICSMAQFYYNEGRLYDNVFTWTSAGGNMEKYRTADRWDWWGDTEPSMAPITESNNSKVVYGDANCDGKVDISDLILIKQTLSAPSKFKLTVQGKINADCSHVGDGITDADAEAVRKYILKKITALPEK